MAEKTIQPEILPAEAEKLQSLLYQTVAVSLEDDDDATTKSDLAHINNHLAMNDAALKNVRSVVTMCALANTACKLIETRRKVKKLPFGTNANPTGRTWEVLP